VARLVSGSIPLSRSTSAQGTPTETSQRSTVTTQPASVPSSTPPPGRAGGRPWLVAAAIAAVAGTIAAGVVEVPYFAIAPGSAIEVTPLVEVVDAPSFEPEGGVFLTTVSLQKATALQAIEGWIDPVVEVVQERVILPPETDARQLRELNLQFMDRSKESALGVAFEYLDYDAIQGGGAEVAAVVADSPADGVLEVGDRIVAVGRDPVDTHAEAVRLLGDREPGDGVTIEVEAPDGERRTVEVRLAENPNVPGRAFLGVSLQTRDLGFDFPFEVNIASDRIGGPSAGLAFTLGILDVLTEGELTGGRKVAATGTIELDGSVGEVGGVAQKTIAVREAGIDLFLVPQAEVDQARRHAGDGLRVEGVEDLGDALRILAAFGGNGLALPRPESHGA
jgi:PDZ domain-containing protein